MDLVYLFYDQHPVLCVLAGLVLTYVAYRLFCVCLAVVLCLVAGAARRSRLCDRSLAGAQVMARYVEPTDPRQRCTSCDRVMEIPSSFAICSKCVCAKTGNWRGSGQAHTIEYSREIDGRWIAELLATPGALAYGETKTEARNAARKIRAVYDCSCGSSSCSVCGNE